MEEDIPEGALYLSGDCEREKSTRMTNEKTTAWIRYIVFFKNRSVVSLSFFT